MLDIRPNRHRLLRTVAVACLVLLSANTGFSREYSYNWKQLSQARRGPSTATASRPIVEYAAHTRGLIQLAVANNGTFGTYGQDIVDPFTGDRIYSCVYPKDDNIVYLWVASLWIGAVVGKDTVVSTGVEDFYINNEFWPETDPFGRFERKSIDLNSRNFDRNAYSEEDFYCEYTDTLKDPALVAPDQVSNGPHRPLNVQVKQRSMAWSYAYADDFILFDYQIKNIGSERLRGVYMGIWVDGDVWHTSRNGPEGWNDDMVGFLQTHPAPEGCGFVDTVNIAYTADADGDPEAGKWDYRSARNVVGARVVRTPSDSLDISYNWWIINYSDPALDFGPRLSGTTADPMRSLGSRKGTPEGDRNKYYLLRHREFDYDLLYTAVNHIDEGFEAPPALADVYARGFDTRYLLSFGPFQIDPGQSLPISLAWVGGSDFHQSPTSFDAITEFNQRAQIDAFYDRLNFSDLALNSRWASWVYDNPGRDTDGDGYSGKYRVCNYDSIITDIDSSVAPPDTIWQYSVADTFFYEGDGVPDFEGAGPPPAPRFRIIPGLGKLTIRFNGYYSETTRDPFLGKVDFEGYRVYVGLDDRSSSLSVLSSWDIEDYSRFVWSRQSSGQLGWLSREIPMTLDQLREQYGDPEFDPREYTRQDPLEYNDSLYYFAPQDYNASSLTEPGGIHKVYPHAPNPGTDTSLWTEEDLVYDYGIGLPKHYEYEIVYDDLLPTIPYYTSVTAFDFGSPGSGLDALETSPLNNLTFDYPQITADEAEAQNLDVYVYPNPYRTDAGYETSGFENRDHTLATERARLIHFSNLPGVCRISIYSLDGDLVRSWDHDFPDGGPGAMHDSWDLITRNTQSAVSGLYYWVVESDERTQIGKLVIMR